ncbi:MAG: ferrous iron transport protein B [Candidatus Helarchaeota archaeon]
MKRHRGSSGKKRHRLRKGQKTEPQFRIVLLGNPNVGKSVIFYRLTHTYVIASNFPGTSVSITEGIGKFEGKTVRVVDTPGIYKLTPISEDERVARSVLIDENPNAVLQIAEAKNLRRTVLFSLQILELGIPSILVLNMWDELRDQKIDLVKLETLLGIPVVNTVATEKTGIKKLKHITMEVITKKYKFNPYFVDYPPKIEEAIERIQENFQGKQLPFSTRAFSLMLLEGDLELERWIARSLGLPILKKIQTIIKETRKKFNEPLNFIITQRRELKAREIVSQVVSNLKPSSSSIGDKISQISIHKIWGPLILLGVLILVFLFVGYVGAVLLVNLAEGELFGGIINPFLNSWVKSFIPNNAFGHVVTELVVGVPELGDTAFGIATIGMSWIFGLILPIVFTFFLSFAILEDSGYLSRIAILTNQFAKKMGLSGKAMIPMILGLGCGTTAHLTTRILDTKKERIIASLLVALAVPCSAQLGILMGFISTFGISWLLVGFSVVFLQLFLIGWLASRIVQPEEKVSLMIEIPPLRIPKLENVLIKTWKRVTWFMKEAIPLFLIGILILSILSLTGVDILLNDLFYPITNNFLGLPSQSANAFVSAILRRDLGAVVFFEIPGLTAIQATVGFTVLTLFLPCLASMFMIIKERGFKVASLIISFVFAYAIAIGSLLNLILTAIFV